MGTVVFALSYQYADGTIPRFSTHVLADRTAEEILLGPMTRIFRQAFRSAFETARIFTGEAGRIETESATIRLLNACIFRTSETITVGSDERDYILVTLIDFTLKSPAEDFRTHWKTHFASLESKCSLARSLGLDEALSVLATATDRIVGQTSTPLEIDVTGLELSVMSSFAFYVAAWLNSLRIERRQMFAQLEPVSSLDLASGIEVANQRLRILNQQRFFLTSDRTNNLALRKLCEVFADKFKIAQRNTRALELHGAFEHHLDNSTKLDGAQRLGSVNNLILILTVLSVPISFFSAIFAINLKSEAFEKPWDLLGDYRIYVAFLIGAAVVGLPFIVLKIFDKARIK